MKSNCAGNAMNGRVEIAIQTGTKAFTALTIAISICAKLGFYLASC